MSSDSEDPDMTPPRGPYRERSGTASEPISISDDDSADDIIFIGENSAKRNNVSVNTGDAATALLRSQADIAAVLENTEDNLRRTKTLRIHGKRSSESTPANSKRQKITHPIENAIDLTALVDSDLDMEDAPTTDIPASDEVVELPDDHEDVFTWVYGNRKLHRAQKQEDEDYDTLYEYMNPNRSSNWARVELKERPVASSSQEPLMHTRPRRMRRDEGILPQRSHIWTKGPPESGFLKPSTCGFRRSQAHEYYSLVARSNHLRRRRVLHPMAATYEVPLRLSMSFNEGSGAVNMIAQHKGVVVIASATDDGLQEENEINARRINVHNYAGNLRIWRQDRDQPIVISKAHTVPKKVRGRGTVQRWCCVNSVAFDPYVSDQIVSVGHDGHLCRWNTDGEEMARYKYDGEPAPVPWDLLYHHREPLLAVPCNDGFIQLHRNSELEPCRRLSTKKKPSLDQSAGVVLWGHGMTDGYIFSSTESRDVDHLGFGSHKMFDIETGKLVSSFAVYDEGDAMAIDPLGNTVALCTWGEDHRIRLFDVFTPQNRNRQPSHIKLVEPIAQTIVEEFIFPYGPWAHTSPYTADSPPPDAEVKVMSFSPDGVYLMTARNDNEVHVYDRRFLGQGDRGKPLMYVHDGDDRTTGTSRYGVTEAKWVDGWGGLGLGIVSGGQDGCVTLWDVRKAGDLPNCRQVLAQADSDVAHFSIGNEHEGENPLVIGDSGGAVYIYERTNRLDNFDP